MKVTDVKTYVVANPPPYHGGPYFVFLKLTTDDKIEGFGEVYGVPFHPNMVTRMIEDVAERYVVGWSPFKIESLWRIIYSSGYTQHPDLTLVAVLSGIEMACWDIVGKALNQPIYNLLGGQVHEKLRSYTYLYPTSGTSKPKSKTLAPMQIGSAFGDPELAGRVSPHRVRFEDVDGDGDTDAILHLSVRDIAAEQALNSDSVMAELTGTSLVDSTPLGIRATDSVRIVPLVSPESLGSLAIALVADGQDDTEVVDAAFADLDDAFMLGML